MRDNGGSFGHSAPFLGDFKIQETLAAGTIALWVSGDNATLRVSTTSSLVDAMGMVVAAAQGQTLTYSATQGDTEGVATVIYDPLHIFEVKINPGATSGTAYADADGYFLTATTDVSTGLTITDTQVGGSTNEADDGLVFAISGANAGLDRIITTQTANTSVVVTVPFLNDIDTGDTFVYSQYAPGVIGLDLTSDLKEADGGAAGANGGDARTVRVRVETDSRGATLASPQLYLDMVLLDHAFNSFTN